MAYIRLGIVGLGAMALQHARGIMGKMDEVRITAVASRNEKNIAVLREMPCGGEIQVFDTPAQMYESGAVDAVLICSPHRAHTAQAVEAFEHGVHVLLEKPVGVFTREVHDMIAAADRSGKAFGVMFNQRTNPVYRKMKEIVQSGEMGEIRRVNIIITDWFRAQSYFDSGAWRATWKLEGGGVLLNQAPHNLDLWQWIFGMPQRIFANCAIGKYHDIEVEDDVTAMAEYANGATGVFITTTGEYPGTNRLEITGSKGKLVYEDGHLMYTKLSADERDVTANSTKGFDTIPNETVELQVEGHGEQHVGILKNFTNHILHGEPLLAPGMEGVNGLSISNAMMLSSWKNQWVEVKNDGEEFWEALQKKIATSKAKEDSGVVFSTEGTYGNK